MRRDVLLLRSVIAVHIDMVNTPRIRGLCLLSMIKSNFLRDRHTLSPTKQYAWFEKRPESHPALTTSYAVPLPFMPLGD